MKEILISLFLILMVTDSHAAEKKLVCIDKTDKRGKVIYDKSGKPEKQCRMMRVHKKLKGTPVK